MPSRAYVTLVSNGDYAQGALALMRSLSLTGTAADLVVLHTDAVSREDLDPLATLGAHMHQVAPLPTSAAFNARHGRGKLHAAAPFTKGRKPVFHTPLDNFVKLRAWQLVAYEKIVFIDADAIVVKNIDRLFDYPEFSAAPNVYESLADFHRLNSGVFVARPAHATFDRMLAALDRPGAFWQRTDQTFLQSFFPDWHGLPVFFNLLQYVWLNLPELWDWRSVCVIHYQYEKPWEADHPLSDRLRVLTDLWRAYAHGSLIPDLASLPHPPVRD